MFNQLVQGMAALHSSGLAGCVNLDTVLVDDSNHVAMSCLCLSLPSDEVGGADWDQSRQRPRDALACSCVLMCRCWKPPFFFVCVSDCMCVLFE